MEYIASTIRGQALHTSICRTFQSTRGHGWHRVWDKSLGARHLAKDCGPCRPLVRRSKHGEVGHQFWLLEEAGK